MIYFGHAAFRHPQIVPNGRKSAVTGSEFASQTQGATDVFIVGCNAADNGFGRDLKDANPVGASIVGTGNQHLSLKAWELSLDSQLVEIHTPPKEPSFPERKPLEGPP